jgi:hypothetical protein
MGVASHGLVVTAIQAGEQPDIETFLQLGAELLTIHKLTSIQSHDVDTIKDTRKYWQTALECFRASEALWCQLSFDGQLQENHARLLQRLCASAEDQVDFYSEPVSDRLAYRARKAESRIK